MSYNDTKEIESLCKRVESTFDIIVNDILPHSTQTHLNVVLNGAEIISDDEGNYSESYLNRIYRSTSQSLNTCRSLLNRCGNALVDLSELMDKIEVDLNAEMSKRV